jgi:2-polyprenyl-3-methyl-5-hydroxy-6-metoxy-1,4-benzoquinol methylase
MSILHLVDKPQATIQQVYDLLKPNGIFISSTPCISGLWLGLKLVMPIAVPLGLLPKVQFFSHEKLIGFLKESGFRIETHWIPDENKMTSFIIAKKPT